MGYILTEDGGELLDEAGHPLLDEAGPPLAPLYVISPNTGYF